MAETGKWNHAYGRILCIMRIDAYLNLRIILVYAVACFIRLSTYADSGLSFWLLNTVPMSHWFSEPLHCCWILATRGCTVIVQLPKTWGLLVRLDSRMPSSAVSQKFTHGVDIHKTAPLNFSYFINSYYSFLWPVTERQNLGWGADQ